MKGSLTPSQERERPSDRQAQQNVTAYRAGSKNVEQVFYLEI